MPEAKFHRGRLFDHVHLRAADLRESKRFYRAVLEALGLAGAIRETDEYFSIDDLWIDKADGPVSRVHIAFQARNPEQVKAFHEAALAAGGRDNGPPGERAHYHPGYYAAFAFDPDGNNIEAVYHGPHERSAESVVFTTRMPTG
jgi:catechol 2,3-dioxygenase-like lactoylglutathione lyase family enzyme